MDNNLEKLRKSAHLTQHKLGKQLGLSQQVISRIERDISTITLEHLLLLADFYQVSIDYLLDRTKAKRSWEEQQVISEVLEEHYELVRALEMLDERDTGLVWALIEKMLEVRSDMMLDIAICDDDNSFAGGLEKTLCRMEKTYGLKFEIDVYQDGCSLVKEVMSGKRYDIICMDIQMREMDGVEAARQIRKLDRVVELIYVTSYDSYMKEVFEVTPSGFIVKPLNQKEFETTFCRVMRTVIGQDAYYRFRYKKEEYKLLIRNILYFTSDLRKTYIVEEGGRYMEYRKLNDISKNLGQENGMFVRIHKSYLVNYRHIVRFSYDTVKLSNGEVLPVSSHRKQEVDEQLAKLMSLLPK